MQAMMSQITKERGNLDLHFLCELHVEEAAAWLNRFEGVGLKTTACVLLFSFKLAILPVDVHVHRTSGRVGLIGKIVSADAVHDLCDYFNTVVKPRTRYTALTHMPNWFR